MTMTLNIETDYRLRGLAYKNLDFNTDTSSDTIAYYTQRLRLGISGSFPTAKSNSNIEIYCRLQALGVVGGDFSILKPTLTWINELPYPNIQSMPFVENAYLKLINFDVYPVDIILGRQPLNYGTGLIIADNGIGYDALRLVVKYPEKFKTELFTAKVSENFISKSDNDINALVVSGPYKTVNFDVGLFNFKDYSGSLYEKFSSTDPFNTKSISKQFYDFHFSQKVEDDFGWDAGISLEKGSVITDADRNISIDAYYYYFSGYHTAKTPRYGIYTSKVTVAGASGDDPSDDNRDGAFSPPFTKKFDGLERIGLGTLMAMSPYNSFMDIIRKNYSGLGVFSIGVESSPFYSWALGVDVFMYSASKSKYPGAGPAPSNYEKWLLQQECSVGSEWDYSLKYTYSKYLGFVLSWNTFKPPDNFKLVWNTDKPKNNELILFETTWKF